MTGSSKILTVSYGTFSCTLEGFDDPFSTMRTIAEYFRDLAAEDRYFGAEPPVPDPEMLQNLAEREATRRVEARMAEGSIALRQMDQPEDETGETIDAAPDVTEAAEAFEADEPENAFSDIAEGGEATADSIAEKLKRIRAVVSRSRDAAPFPEEDADNSPAPATSFEDEDLVEDEGASDDVSLAGNDDGPSEADIAEARLSDTIASLTAAAEADDLTEDELDGIEEEVAPELDAHLNDGFDDIDDAEQDEDPVPVIEATDDVVETTEASVEAMPADEEESDDKDDVVEEKTFDGPETVLTLVSNDPSSEIEDEDDTPAAATEEPDVARLMEEAEHQFEDGEGQRRRRVISQLRAAVVAAKADRESFGGNREEDDALEQIAYREDLSRVVSRKTSVQLLKPKPVEDTPAPVPTEEKPAPAPLMLGSEQRVEPEAPAEVKPDRVAVDPSAEKAKDMASFADFAAAMGATELPDLLEAAAAYTAFVEGQGSFSRPQIMKRVARIQPAVELSREAGLRSFGQLLRQGKIQKLHRGEFTISETTRFRPGHQIAGE